MSTIYNFHEEVATIDAVASGDILLIFDTSSGRTKQCTVDQLTTAESGAVTTVTFVTGATGFDTDSASVTTSAGAATNSKMAGTITTDTSTLVGQGAVLALTITNTLVTVGDIIMATLDNGTNTTGIPVLSRVHAGAGVMNFSIYNAATTATNAFGGTFVVNYVLFKK